MKINPILYHIDFTSSVTWPPLLWGDRMRSIFLEPSYCAIFLSSVLPIFLICFNNENLAKRKYVYYALFTLIMFIIFATNSKTAMVLIFFLCLYVLLLGLIYRKFFKRSLLLLMCVVVACVGYFGLLRTAYIIPAENPAVQWNIVKDVTKKMNIQTNNIPKQQYSVEKSENQSTEVNKKQPVANNKKQFTNTNKKQAVTLDKKQSVQNGKMQSADDAFDSYVDKNINNLTNVNYGSNSSRYGVTFAELGVFLDNPVFGTGSAELLQPYIYEHFPDFSDNAEVRRWTKFNWEHGVMSHQMPVLNDFSNKLAKFGLVGFIVFYFPLLYFLFRIFKNWKKMSFIDKQYICSLLAGICCIFIGCMAGPLNLFFTYWVFLGLLGAIAFTDYDKDKNVE